MDALGTQLAALNSWVATKYAAAFIPASSQPQIIVNADGGGTIVCPTPAPPVGKAQWPFSPNGGNPLAAISAVVSEITAQ
jgi:hypothetical protein